MKRFSTEDGRIFELVSGNDLVPLSSGFGDPYFPEFFWSFHPEKDYILLLNEAFSYFEKLQSGLISIDDSTYQMQIPKTDGRNAFMQPWLVFVEKAVKVRKLQQGKYEYAGDDGRHRYEAARRHAMQILVEIV